MKESHKKAISKSRMGHIVSKKTRKKIGDANRGVWIKFKCDSCKKESEEKQSHYKKSKRHFCDKDCYSRFREELLPKEEHNSYGHGLSIEERKKRVWCRSTLNHAIRDGLMTRKDCDICGRKAQAHHEDYTKPLDVRWLCFYHHRKEAHGQKPIYENPELIK